MTQDEKAAMYQKYLPMVTRLAEKMSSGYPPNRLAFLEAGRDYLADTVAVWNTPKNTWNPSKSSLTTWVYRGIRYRMLDVMRSRQSRNPPQELKPNRFVAKPTRPWLCQLLSDLGEEAATVVNLVLIAPAEIVDEISVATRGRGRAAVKEYLTERMGWNEDKIEAAFSQVREAL